VRKHGKGPRMRQELVERTILTMTLMARKGFTGAILARIQARLNRMNELRATRTGP
jgi:hypothetical protein